MNKDMEKICNEMDKEIKKVFSVVYRILGDVSKNGFFTLRPFKDIYDLEYLKIELDKVREVKEHLDYRSNFIIEKIEKIESELYDFIIRSESKLIRNYVDYEELRCYNMLF